MMHKAVFALLAAFAESKRLSALASAGESSSVASMSAASFNVERSQVRCCHADRCPRKAYPC